MNGQYCESDVFMQCTYSATLRSAIRCHSLTLNHQCNLVYAVILLDMLMAIFLLQGHPFFSWTTEFSFLHKSFRTQWYKVRGVKNFKRMFSRQGSFSRSTFNEVLGSGAICDSLAAVY